MKVLKDLVQEGRSTRLKLMKKKHLEESPPTPEESTIFRDHISVAWGTLNMETAMFQLDVQKILDEFTGISNLRLVNNVSCLSGYVVDNATKTPLDLSVFITYLESIDAAFKYKPAKFSGLSYQHRLSVPLAKLLFTLTGKKMKTTTFLCFKSGQIVMVGLKLCSIQFLKPLIQQFLEVLAQSHALTHYIIYRPHVANMVFSFSLNNTGTDTLDTLPLYKFSGSELAKKHVHYFPILFPGAKVLIPGSSAICTLFTSRKAIFTGGGGYNLKHFSEGMKLVSEILDVIGINILKP